MKIQEAVYNFIMIVFTLLIMGCLFMAVLTAFSELVKIFTNYDIIRQSIQPMFQ